MKTKKLTHLALLIAFALVLHTVEAAIPLPMIVPGAKLGLANVITLLALILYGFGAALFVAIIRTVLGSIFVGNFLGLGFWLSFSGAMAATLVMTLALLLWRRGSISLIAVSILGATAHSTAQVSVAALVIQNVNLIRLYLPLLLLLALPTGFFTGLVAAYTQRKLPPAVTQP